MIEERLKRAFEAMQPHGIEAQTLAGWFVITIARMEADNLRARLNDPRVLETVDLTVGAIENMTGQSGATRDPRRTLELLQTILWLENLRRNAEQGATDGD